MVSNSASVKTTTTRTPRELRSASEGRGINGPPTRPPRVGQLQGARKRFPQTYRKIRRGQPRPSNAADASPSAAGSSSLHAAEQVEQAQPPHQPNGLPDDAPVHLGESSAPVHEHDRNLAQPEALLPALERHLDLERVAVRLHPVEVHALERLAPE